jgi:hypothetical protein
MGIGQARQHQPPTQVDQSGVGTSQRSNLGVVPYGQEATTGNSNGRGMRSIGILSTQPTVVEK